MTDPSPEPFDQARTRDQFIEDGLERVTDDPYAELFADCTTAEDIIELQREVDASEG